MHELVRSGFKQGVNLSVRESRRKASSLIVCPDLINKCHLTAQQNRGAGPALPQQKPRQRSFTVNQNSLRRAIFLGTLCQIIYFPVEEHTYVEFLWRAFRQV